ncbi:MAG: hypothetical protein IKP86_09660, partial [Anaerolineaceae bacterium]|nr:hypothetical protein [Anaerolineaceae bacterium]
KLSLEDIPVYDYDPDAADALLNKAGWNLNQNGAAFQRGTDKLRYKQINGALVPLQLTMAYPEGTSVETGLLIFGEVAADEGINITMTAIPMEDILVEYYAEESARQYDMLFLALNFDVMFDPSRDFEYEDTEVPVWIKTGLADKELYDLTVAMRTTEPGDLLTYCQHWLAYQQRMAELVPVMPLYSNVYFDFYARVLQDYYISANISWAEAVVPAFLGEIVEEEEVLDEEFGDDEFIEFG